MFLTILQATGSLVLLCVGGECLIRGAGSIAQRLGVSRLAIGLTVVAFGTSTPELIVSVDAALAGANDIAVGNVVGSNIANIALILAVAALLRPTVVQAKVVRVDLPLMVVASVVLLAMVSDGQASRLEGVALLLGLVAYTVFTFWEARRESGEVRAEFASAAREAPVALWISGLLVLVGIVMLTAGGDLLVRAAVTLGRLLGIREATIGLTVVAVGTSLPEMAASVIAARRGQGDIAVGNVVGSNIFNILGILGVTAVIKPLALGGITWIDLGTMLALACILMVLLGVRPRLGRREGVLLLLGYAVYTGWLLTK